MILPKKYSIANLMNERLPPVRFIDFNFETKRCLLNFFNSIIEAERSNERLKSILASTPNSSAFDCFNDLKPNYSNSINKTDISSFFHLFGRILTPFELELLFQKLDKNKDGVITFNEFLPKISPSAY